MRLPTVPSAASSAALIHLDPADHCREDLVAMYLKTRRRQISSPLFFGPIPRTRRSPTRPSIACKPLL